MLSANHLLSRSICLLPLGPSRQAVRSKHDPLLRGLLDLARISVLSSPAHRRDDQTEVNSHTGRDRGWLTIAECEGLFNEAGYSCGLDPPEQLD